MKGLLKSELQDGHVYYCLLAQRPVQIKKDRGIYFHDGSFNVMDLNDGQFVEYEMPTETRINLPSKEKHPMDRKPSPMYPVKKVLDDINEKYTPF